MSKVSTFTILAKRAEEAPNLHHEIGAV